MSPADTPGGSEQPRPRYCPDCGDVMNVLAPSYNHPNETGYWRHECTDCNLVKLEEEMQNKGESP